MDQSSKRIVISVILIGIVVLIFLWVIKYFNIYYPIAVTNQSVAGELSVVGTGQVDVTPNSATVSIGIVENGTTAKEVEQAISTANNKIVAAVQGLGIAKKDIKTTNYSINPNYSYDGGRNTINGYVGNATLSVTVKDTTKLSDVIVAATNAGANNISDTQYKLDNPEKYQEEARNKAIANAKEQAQKLSNQLGIKLGKVVNIAESSPSTPPVMMYDKALSIAPVGGAAPQLQPGQQTITSTVTLYFERR
jgi:uncharacterized protein YggE